MPNCPADVRSLVSVLEVVALPPSVSTSLRFRSHLPTGQLEGSGGRRITSSTPARAIHFGGDSGL